MKAIEGVVASWDGVQKWFGDGIEGTVIDAPSPNKFVNVVNVLLVGFGGEEAFGKPCSTKKGPDVFIAKQGVDVFLDDGAFVDAAVGLATSDGWGGTCVNAEFETKHGAGGAVGVEGIPV